MVQWKFRTIYIFEGNGDVSDPIIFEDAPIFATSVNALSNGTFVASYGDNNANRTGLYKVFSNNGVLQHTEYIREGSNKYSNFVIAQVLSNNNLAIIYKDSDDSGRLIVLDPSGQAIVKPEVKFTNDFRGSKPSVVILPDDSIIVT